MSSRQISVKMKSKSISLHSHLIELEHVETAKHYSQHYSNTHPFQSLTVEHEDKTLTAPQETFTKDKIWSKSSRSVIAHGLTVQIQSCYVPAAARHRYAKASRDRQNEVCNKKVTSQFCLTQLSISSSGLREGGVVSGLLHHMWRLLLPLGEITQW